MTEWNVRSTFPLHFYVTTIGLHDLDVFSLSLVFVF